MLSNGEGLAGEQSLTVTEDEGALGRKNPKKRRQTRENLGSAAVFGGTSVFPFGSHVVVERELVRVRTQADRVDLGVPLELDVGLDQVRGEHAAFEKEVVVRLEVVDDRGEAVRHLR